MIGLAWMLARDDYDRSMSQLDFHGSPWDALLTWLPIRYAHKQASMMLWPETEVREDYWTHCCFCNFTIHIYFSSLSLFLFLTLEISFLTFSHLFWQRQARLTKTPFLVSKQVILFSIPVSLETVIICPLKRSHTHTPRRNTGKACERNCRSWFGKGNYMWPFTTNTTSAAAHFSVSRTFCFARNYSRMLPRGRLVWRQIYCYQAEETVIIDRLG